MTQHRFLVLDGLRGVAAFAVLWGHAGFGFGAGFFPRHADLAVDFFFCLSGFVVAHAYAARIAGGLGFWGFGRLRLIRLYPMILAGGVLGALAFDPGWDGGLAQLAWYNAAAILLLPLGLAFNDVPFPANGPVWSLFFEFCANAVYWAAARRQGGSALVWAVFVAGAAVLLGLAAYRYGDLSNVGASPGALFLFGFARVAVSFALGVLIFSRRLHERLPRLPDICVALALAALFLMPKLPWWYDMGCVLVAFPLLLCLGAQARETPRLHGLWYWCGALSYPVYVIHQPVLRAVFRLHGDGFLALLLTMAAGWAVLRWYDEPVRRALARRATPRGRRG